MSKAELPSRDEIALRFLTARLAGNVKFSLRDVDYETCCKAYVAAEIFLQAARDQNEVNTDAPSASG